MSNDGERFVEERTLLSEVRMIWRNEEGRHNTVIFFDGNDR